MKKIIAISCLAALAFTGTAMAGESRMKNADGMKLHIKCTGGGCKVRGKTPGGKWGTVEKTKGGRDNYLLLVEKYEGKGFK